MHASVIVIHWLIDIWGLEVYLVMATGSGSQSIVE